ncbi:MAG: porphobilinogen synthase [Proteobacteria bacterium]|nr:porphobilinogen synthase [Pseudomonadota bacterium]
MPSEFDLPFRFRRNRRSPALRSLVRETTVTADDLILPLFFEEKIKERTEVASLPGVFRYPEAQVADVVTAAWEKGIKAVLLFGVSHSKDEEGSDTWDEDGLIARMTRAAREAVPEMVIITDNCFCSYTTHGHCGVVVNDHVDNDLTLHNLQKQCVAAAEAGADMVAPSGMMDGMVLAIREALDDAGFEDAGILSYSSKFASSFYGPFREAGGCGLKGDRKTYQIDPANGREAVMESVMDEDEGADMLMVKPGLAYLDIVKGVREACGLPLAVYQVSGEYAMIKAAAAAGSLDEKAAVMETMTAFKRAGADMIITYFAAKVADWLKEGR